jgi:hypothetical protein
MYELAQDLRMNTYTFQYQYVQICLFSLRWSGFQSRLQPYSDMYTELSLKSCHDDVLDSDFATTCRPLDVFSVTWLETYSRLNFPSPRLIQTKIYPGVSQLDNTMILFRKGPRKCQVDIRDTRILQGYLGKSDVSMGICPHCCSALAQRQMLYPLHSYQLPPVLPHPRWHLTERPSATDLYLPYHLLHCSSSRLRLAEGGGERGRNRHFSVGLLIYVAFFRSFLRIFSSFSFSVRRLVQDSSRVCFLLQARRMLPELRLTNLSRKLEKSAQDASRESPARGS